MKKYIFIFAAILLFNPNLGLAVPLVITNNSINDNFPGMYRVNTYLGFLEDGNTCNDDWVLPFIFDPGASLTIDDGSFMFQSPFNNFQDCLSNFLGYNSCEPIDLAWDGQRISFEALIDNNDDSFPNNSYPAGTIGLSTGGVECQGMNLTSNAILYNESTTSYSLLILNPSNPNEPIGNITYNRYGNVLATLRYE